MVPIYLPARPGALPDQQPLDWEGLTHTETKCQNTEEKGDTSVKLLHGKPFKTRSSMLKHHHFIKIKSALFTTLIIYRRQSKTQADKSEAQACPTSKENARLGETEVSV